MWVRVAITIVLLLLPTALHAAAEKRIALLIGNKDYKAGVGTLTNPLNDIRIVGDAQKIRRLRGSEARRECTAIGDVDCDPRVRSKVEIRWARRCGLSLLFRPWHRVCRRKLFDTHRCRRALDGLAQRARCQAERGAGNPAWRSPKRGPLSGA